LIADAGYGGEQNYEYLEKNDITAYVKYNTYKKELKKRDKKNRYKSYRWGYDPQRDELTCPEGQKWKYLYTKTCRNKSGYESTRRMYQCGSCDRCPVKTECTRGNFRQTAFSPRLWQQRQEVKGLLSSKEGIELRKRRCHKV
jgi:hypothetical protein